MMTAESTDIETILIDKIARAIKDCTDGFSNPVNRYIKGEAKHRWEEAHPPNHTTITGLLTVSYDDWWHSQPESLDDLVDYKIIAMAVLQAFDSADWVVVPRIPTQAMLDAGWYAAHDEDAADTWRDMIKAAQLSSGNSN